MHLSRAAFSVEEIADRFNDLKIGALGTPADNVALADRARSQDQLKRANMVVDVKPVANIVTLAVDRQGLFIEGIQDRERNELFRKMKGTVIVRAVGESDRQPKVWCQARTRWSEAALEAE